MRAGTRYSLVTAAALVLVALPTSAQGSFPGRNGKIAYDSTSHLCGGQPCGRRHIYTVNADGSGRRQLTRQRDAVEPALSRDGREIAFSAVSGLFVMDSSGHKLHRIARHGSWPTFAPDGKRLAYDWTGTHGKFALWVVQASGKGAHQIVQDAQQPDWSPDGRRIAFQRGLGIYVVSAKGGSARKVVRGGSGFYPSWSPDGRRIAFLTSSHTIAVVSASGGSIRNVAADANGKPAWSPDGKWLAYPRLNHDQQSIVAVRTNGSGHTVVKHTGRSSGVSWAPR